MKYPIWKPLLIVALIALCGWMIQIKGLRPGLDLAGGTTMLYDVKVPEDADASTMIDDMINILRDRVDPTGTRNLIWRQVAGNRIEIQMALASPETKRLREAYVEAFESLRASNISETAVDAALRQSGAARSKRLRSMAHENPDLENALADLAQAHDALVIVTEPYQQAQRKYDQAKVALENLPPDASDQKKQAETAAVDELLKDLQAKARSYRDGKKRFDTVQSRVLAANVDPNELKRVLDMPVEPARKNQPSRETALQQLLDAHPERAAQIRAVADTYAAYEKVKGPLDDPNDLITLLRGSGVLEFRIAATPDDPGINEMALRQQLREKGPSSGLDKAWRWFEIHDIDQFTRDLGGLEALERDPEAYFTDRGLVGQAYGDGYFVLLANTQILGMTRDEQWELSWASRGFDQLGRTAIDFALDARGGALMGGITGPNIGKPMAILLDRMVISAPNLQSKINDRGQITGDFTAQAVDYLIRILKAGSTEAELGDFPISQKTIGAQLGQDNIDAGLEAAIWALVAVACLIATYYFFAGLVANFALLANMVIILGIMALFEATFTLPGIAGIILTIGMAVDANILIFERIREEMEHKADLPTAVRLGFSRALSTILDANLTTFITCVVLYYTATAEIKGFAITLMIGILATLFTALFSTRVIIDLYVIYGKARTLAMLPSVVTSIRTLLSPNINWVGKRHLFFGLSVIVVVLGMTMVFSRGQDMLDIEFRSGTQVSFQFKNDAVLPIDQVRDRLVEHGELGAKISTEGFDPETLSDQERALYPAMKRIVDAARARFDQSLADARRLKAEGKDVGEIPTAPPDFALLASAVVVPEGDMIEGTSANGFSASTLIVDSQAVSAVIKAAFSDQLDTTRPLEFAAMTRQRVNAAPVYAVRSANLGDNINRPDVREDVSAFLGGIVLLLEDLDPPPTLADLEQRIGRMRNQPAYEGLGYRERRVVGLDLAPSGEAGPGDELRYRSAAVVAHESETNYLDTPDALTESGGLADTEWSLARDALRRDTSLASVSNFSSQVSKTMKQHAIAALTLSLLAVIAYVWFRFGSFRYGLAAIVALVHDVCITLGLVAISGWLYGTPLAHALMLDPFKINLAMVAAFLTIVGYSLNDTIVIFDRIRENRGRLARATAGIINHSINQTISRTVLTSGTTFLAVGVLYVFGGSGVHGFAFAMLIGVVVGTYSSVAIAAPILLLGAPASKPA